jgi:beta-xylosidase
MPAVTAIEVAVKINLRMRTVPLNQKKIGASLDTSLGKQTGSSYSLWVPTLASTGLAVEQLENEQRPPVE